ncbi:hypothetical protein ACM26V_02245 [Salipaludibacillus sp. HK11]|uniref:hypothetical protein n=1 Tax=Salipaludibacillus sp. HK11 TaxID=3394320 RepID=UPI0039FD4DDD
MQYEDSEQYLLEINESDEKVQVFYANDPQPFLLPKIGPRPPCYTNQRFGKYYPIL